MKTLVKLAANSILYAHLSEFDMLALTGRSAHPSGVCERVTTSTLAI